MRPILYACSGCSKAGFVAYRLALYLNDQGTAEMSCIAGLASGKKSFMKKTLNREVWVIDGCPIQCAKAITTNMGITESRHIRLYEHGIKKNQEPDPSLKMEDLAKIVLTSENTATDAGTESIIPHIK